MANNWLFGGGGGTKQSSGQQYYGGGVQWPGMAPSGYPVGAGASATDPNSLPGAQQNPYNKVNQVIQNQWDPRGTQGGSGSGIAGPQVVLGPGNPYNLPPGTIVAGTPGAPVYGGTPIQSGQTVQGQTYPASVGSGGIPGAPVVVASPYQPAPVTFPPPVQVAPVEPPPPPAAPVPTPAPAPVTIPPPAPEPVNEFGRTAAEERAWQIQIAMEQATREEEQKRQDAAAAAQAQATQDLINREEIAHQQKAAAEQWQRSELLKQTEWDNQWNAYLAAVNGMPDPNWNDIPLFQILRGQMPAASFQARGKAAADALAGPTMPVMPGPLSGPAFAPDNGWTQTPEGQAFTREAQNQLNQGYLDRNQTYIKGGPKPKPIKLDLPEAHKVNWQNLQSLSPTELQVLASGIRSQGQSEQDWLEALRRSAPRGAGFTRTGWA